MDVGGASTRSFPAPSPSPASASVSASASLFKSGQVRGGHKSGSFYGRRASGGGTCSEPSSSLASGSVAVLVQLARSGGLFSTNFISGVRPTVPARSHLGWHSTPTVVLSTQAQAQTSAFKLWAEAGA